MFITFIEKFEILLSVTLIAGPDILIAASTFPCLLNTVSYTHLDVYKRQKLPAKINRGIAIKENDCVLATTFWTAIV